MKGLILAGGKGTRLRPITHTSAKQLVPVANKPILFYAIEAIRDAGIREIGVIVGHTKQEIMDACGDGARWGVEITYIEQEAPLGLAHAVKVARDYLSGRRFVMYLGDNLILDGIRGMVDEFRSENHASHILLARVPDPAQFGVAELADGRVVRLVEKPPEPKSDLALVGVYLFDQPIFEAVDAIKPSARGELEITDAIQWLVDNGHVVKPHVVTGWWKDTGKLEDMLEANRMLLDAQAIPPSIEGEVDARSSVHFKVRVAAGAEVINSTIRGPAIIGAGARVVDSYVGPFTSISEGCTLRNVEIEHSIVLAGSSITDIDGRIVDSLIGKNVEVARSPVKPRAFRFMLGDSSKVDIG